MVLHAFLPSTPENGSKKADTGVCNYTSVVCGGSRFAVPGTFSRDLTIGTGVQDFFPESGHAEQEQRWPKLAI